MPTLDQTAVAEVMSVVSDRYVPKTIVEGMVETMPAIGRIVSTEAFYDLCTSIHENSKTQRNVIAQSQHQVRRGMMQNAVARMYSDSVVRLEPANTDYLAWFAERNIDIAGFSNDDLQTMYTEIVREATGLSLNNDTSLANLQKAMLQMLGQLSSYTIQLVGNVNGEGIKRADIPVVRFGNLHGTGAQHDYLPLNPPTVIKTSGFGKAKRKVSMLGDRTGTVTASVRHKAKLKSTVDMKLSRSPMHVRNRVDMVRTMFKPSIPLPTNTKGIVPTLGYASWLDLPVEQKMNLVSIYTGDYMAGPDVAYIVGNYVAPGYVTIFDPPPPPGNVLQPSITTPVTGTVITSTHLASASLSAFALRVGYTDVWLSTDWEFWEAVPDWLGPLIDPTGGVLVYASIEDTVNQATITLDPDAVQSINGTNRTIYIRGRYRDLDGDLSAWSDFSVITLAHP